MRTTITRGLIPALVLLICLGIGGEARAGGKVDWSEYLEPAGSKPPPIKHTVAAPAEEVASAPAATKASRGKAAKKQRATKAKKKPPARTARRRK